ncbi:alternative sulfate transporter [Colletotrichum camelliae]|nr:alternative sulfate transporter [Colletotrichum camelliae]
MGTADAVSLARSPSANHADGDVKQVSSPVDWTEDEERKAKLKLDLIIMPLLTLGFFCLQLDRGNIANAITDTFMEDVGLTQFQFNVGQQLLSLGIVLFEIPSNMILYKVGPGKWLTLQLFFFGLVSTFQAFQHNYAGFLATRFLLRVSESGYIPGGLWTLSTWYTRKETAKRVMIFFFGNQLGQACAKLIAYGILHMKGVAGYPGWFWLFIVMPSPLPAAYWFLPQANIFTERELHILQTRVRIDDPNKMNQKQHIGIAAFKKAFSNWRIWMHIFITLGNNGPFRGFDTYGPTIIRSFGFPSLTSNALASVGLFLQVPMSFGFSYASDRFNKRGETTILAVAMHMFGYILNRIFTEISRRGVRYFGVVWTQTFASFPHPLNITWMSLTCTDPEERSLAMAMIIMSANIAAIYGAHLFQADDKPLYRRAFDSNIGILAFALVLACIRYGHEVYQKRRA